MTEPHKQAWRAAPLRQLRGFPQLFPCAVKEAHMKQLRLAFSQLRLWTFELKLWLEGLPWEEARFVAERFKKSLVGCMR